MKVKATVTPWSSVVGTSVALQDDKGQSVGQLMLVGLGRAGLLPHEVKALHMNVAKAVAEKVDGMELPD